MKTKLLILTTSILFMINCSDPNLSLPSQPIEQN